MPKRSKGRKIGTAFFDAASAIPVNVPWIVPIIIEIIEATTAQTDIAGVTPEQFDDALISAMLVSLGLVTLKEVIYLLNNIEESQYRNFLRVAQYIKLITLDLALPIVMAIEYLGPNWGDMEFIKANDETGTPSTYQNAKILLSLLVIIPCALITNRNFLWQEAVRFKNAKGDRWKFVVGTPTGESQALMTENAERPSESKNEPEKPEMNFDDNIYDAFACFWRRNEPPNNPEIADRRNEHDSELNT